MMKMISECTDEYAQDTSQKIKKEDVQPDQNVLDPIQILHQENGEDILQESALLVSWLQNPNVLKGNQFEALMGALVSYLAQPNVSPINHLLGNACVFLCGQSEKLRHQSAVRLAIYSKCLAYEFRIIMMSVQKFGATIPNLHSHHFASIDKLYEQIELTGFMKLDLITHLSLIAGLLPPLIFEKLKEKVGRDIKRSCQRKDTDVQISALVAAYCHLLYRGNLSSEQKEQSLQELINVMSAERMVSIVHPCLRVYKDKLSQNTLIYLVEAFVLTRKELTDSSPHLHELLALLSDEKLTQLQESLFFYYQKNYRQAHKQSATESLLYVLTHLGHNKREVLYERLFLLSQSDSDISGKNMGDFVTQSLIESVSNGYFDSDLDALWVSRFFVEYGTLERGDIQRKELDYFHRYHAVLEEKARECMLKAVDRLCSNVYLMTKCLTRLRYIHFYSEIKQRFIHKIYLEYLEAFEIEDDKEVSVLLEGILHLYPEEQSKVMRLVVKKLTPDNVFRLNMLKVVSILKSMGHEEAQKLNRRILRQLASALKQKNLNYVHQRNLLASVDKLSHEYPKEVEKMFSEYLLSLMRIDLNHIDVNWKNNVLEIKNVVVSILTHCIPFLEREVLEDMITILKNKDLFFQLNSRKFIDIVAKLAAHLPPEQSYTQLNSHLRDIHEMVVSGARQQSSQGKESAVITYVKNDIASLVQGTSIKDLSLEDVIVPYSYLILKRYIDAVQEKKDPLSLANDSNDPIFLQLITTLVNMLKLCKFVSVDVICVALNHFSVMMNDTNKLYVANVLLKLMTQHQRYHINASFILLGQLTESLQQDAFNHSRLHKFMPDCLRIIKNRSNARGVSAMMSILELNTGCTEVTCKELFELGHSFITGPAKVYPIRREEEKSHEPSHAAGFNTSLKQRLLALNQMSHQRNLSKRVEQGPDTLSSYTEPVVDATAQTCQSPLRHRQSFIQASRKAIGLNKDVVRKIASFLSLRDISALAQCSVYLRSCLRDIVYSQRPTVLSDSLYDTQEQFLIMQSRYQTQERLFLHETVDGVLEYIVANMLVLMKNYHDNPRALYHDFAFVVDLTISHNEYYQTIYQPIRHGHISDEWKEKNQVYSNCLFSLRLLFDGFFYEHESMVLNCQRYVGLFRHILTEHVRYVREMIACSVKGLSLQELAPHMQVHDLELHRQYFDVPLERPVLIRPLYLSVGEMVSITHPLSYQQRVLYDEYHVDLKDTTLLKKAHAANTRAAIFQHNDVSEFILPSSRITDPRPKEYHRMLWILRRGLEKLPKWENILQRLEQEQKYRTQDLLNQMCQGHAKGDGFHYRVGRLRREAFGLQDEKMMLNFIEDAGHEHPRAQFELSQILYEQRQSLRSLLSVECSSTQQLLHLLIRAAAACNERAMLRLAQFFDTYRGFGAIIQPLLQEYEVAIYHEFCSKSMNIVAFMKVFKNVSEDVDVYQEAMVLFEKAIALGNANSQYHLARMLDKGLGCAKDTARAQAILQNIAEQKHFYAMRRLARCAYRAKDQKTALRWYTKLLPYDSAEANFYVAKIRHDDGVQGYDERSEILSLLWNSALLGFYHAYDALGTFLFRANEVELAVACWYKGSQKNHASAAYHLLNFFGSTQGQSFSKSLPWGSARIQAVLAEHESEQQHSLWK